MSGRTLKYLLITIGAIGVITVSCAVNKSPQSASANSQDKWQQQYPQLFNNAGYAAVESRAYESQLTMLKNMPESWHELAGPVTNPFGIRDDILEYTLDTFKDNPKALAAAIAYAQYDYWTSYAGDKQLARGYYQKMGIVGWCITYFSSFNTRLQYSRQEADLLRNTSARAKHERDVEVNYLSPGIYGFGNLTDKQLADKCEQGNY